MKVQSINNNVTTNYYNGNRLQKNNKNISFGGFVISPKYRSELGALVPNESKINVREMINYEGLSQKRKAAADKYFDAMRKAGINVEDLQVNVGERFRCFKPTTLDCSNAPDYYSIYVGFSVPIFPYYKDGKFEYGSFVRKVDVIHSESPNRKDPDIVARDKREFDKISKQMQEIGFELKSPIATAIPNTEKMYDIIAKEISSEIDKLEEIANI